MKRIVAATAIAGFISAGWQLPPLERPLRDRARAIRAGPATRRSRVKPSWLPAARNPAAPAPREGLRSTSPRGQTQVATEVCTTSGTGPPLPERRQMVWAI
jgi:hypothetical protein